MRVQVPTYTQNLTLRTAASPGSYSAEKKAKRLKLAGKVAIGAADAYVSAVSVFNPEASYAPWFGGAMAVGHLAMGYIEGRTHDTDYYGDRKHGFSDRPRDKAVALGHLVTAVGFASMAFGSGALGVPLVGLGQAAVLGAEFLSRDEA